MVRAGPSRFQIASSMTPPDLPTPASEPHDINVGPDGKLWFVETAGNNIGRLRL
jgi:streptogramin lyase